MFENGVILAAGRGVRMLPLSESIPKPLLPNLEDSLLLQQVKFMREHVKRISVTVGYMGGAVKSAALSFGADTVVDIGAGGNASWIHSSDLGFIDTPTLIITCDNIMSVDLGKLEQEVEESPGNAFIIPIERDRAFPGDRMKVIESKIVAMGPQHDSSLLASGLQVMIPSVVRARREAVEDFSEVWADLISHRELNLSRIRPSAWAAIDTPADLAQWSESRRRMKA